MKNKLVKRIALLMAVSVMGISVMACGDKAEETVAEETTTEEASVEETADDTVETEEVEEETTDDAAETEEAVDEAETAEAAGEALTEEEYEAKAAELLESMTTTMTEAQEELNTLDVNDVEGAKDFIEGLKAPFAEFAAVQAPEKYADAQVKFKSSCEAMMEYLDLCISMLDMEEDADTAELTTQLTDLLTTLQNDLTEGLTLMGEDFAAKLAETMN